MPYERVWIPELNAYKIIGEDTGEYAQVYAAMPEATQINLSARSGQVTVFQGETVIAQSGWTPAIAAPDTQALPAVSRGELIEQAAIMGVDEMDMPQFSARDILGLLQFLFGRR